MPCPEERDDDVPFTSAWAPAGEIMTFKQHDLKREVECLRARAGKCNLPIVHPCGRVPGDETFDAFDRAQPVRALEFIGYVGRSVQCFHDCRRSSVTAPPSIPVP